MEKRTEKLSERIAYAIGQLEKSDIEYTLKNESIGHFHCRRVLEKYKGIAKG